MGKCPYRVKNLIERQNPRDMDREKSVRNLNLRGLHVLMTWVHENFQKDWGDFFLRLYRNGLSVSSD